ncbi:MAG: hypothetical protein GY867_13175, partial [bacterium]|nr:hypothetical protein [bacterium]
VAILLVIAVPAFTGRIDDDRLRGVAGGLFQELLVARSESIKRNQWMVVSLNKINNGVWCYGVSDSEAACNCDPNSDGDFSDNDCQVDLLNRVVDYTSFPGVQVSGDSSIRSAFFDPDRGMTWNGVDGSGSLATFTVQFTSAGGKVAQVEVGSLGRAYICALSGDLSSYPAC